jgi:hypothetical protein
MTKKIEKPESIEEALQGRPDVEEIQNEMTDSRTPTEEEMIAMIPGPAMTEEDLAVMRMEELQDKYGQKPNPTTERIGTTTNTETTSQTTEEPIQEAVSNDDLQPADKTSILESPIAPEESKKIQKETKDENLERVEEFLTGRDFNQHWVERQLTLVSSIPEMIPPTTQWNLPAGVDLTQIVYDILMTPDWITDAWPSMKVIMGSSIGNIPWCIKTLCTLALFSAIRLFGLVEKHE